MPWHAWCNHHSQCAASRRTLTCSREEASCFSFLLLMMCAERRNSLCPSSDCKRRKARETPAVGNHNTVDIELQILFIIMSPCWLLTFTPGSLVTSFLKVSAFADSQHKTCRIRHWTYPRLLKSCGVVGMLLPPFLSAICCPWENKKGTVFSHIPLQCSKRCSFLAAVKWDQKLNQVSKV